jgi:PQQ system protein
MKIRRLVVLAAVVTLGVSACGYVRLFRPSVLKQLDPRMVALVNELPELDHPNEAVLGQIFARGGLAHARDEADGVMRVRIKTPALQYLWQPALIVMPHGGDLELDFENHDQNHHIAFLPNNGARMMLDLHPGQHGRVRIRLDEPGMYWFGCPVEDHVTRGMLGFILVKGDVPDEARLDRPTQVRPGRRS